MVRNANGCLMEGYPGEFQAVFGASGPDMQGRVQKAQSYPNLPTRWAEVVQIKSRDVLNGLDTKSGAPKVFVLEDESKLYVPNGDSIDVYAKLPPERVKAMEPVTREEMAAYIQSAVQTAVQAAIASLMAGGKDGGAAE